MNHAIAPFRVIAPFAWLLGAACVPGPKGSTTATDGVVTVDPGVTAGGPRPPSNRRSCQFCDGAGRDS